MAVIILLGDFAMQGQKSFVRGSNSGEKAKFLAELDSLRAPAGAQFVKNAAGMGFDRVFADEEFLGNFAVAHALGDQFKDFQFAGSDGQFLTFFLVGNERHSGRDRDFLDNDGLLFSCQLEAQPDAQNGEDRGDQSAVNLDGVFDYQVPIFRPLQHGDQDSADDSVN